MERVARREIDDVASKVAPGRSFRKQWCPKRASQTKKGSHHAHRKKTVPSYAHASRGDQRARTHRTCGRSIVDVQTCVNSESAEQGGTDAPFRRSPASPVLTVTGRGSFVPAAHGLQDVSTRSQLNSIPPSVARAMSRASHVRADALRATAPFDAAPCQTMLGWISGEQRTTRCSVLETFGHEPVDGAIRATFPELNCGSECDDAHVESGGTSIQIKWRGKGGGTCETLSVFSGSR